MKIKKEFCKNFLVSILLICLLLPFIQQRTFEELPRLLVIFYSFGPVLSATIMYLLCFVRKKIHFSRYLVFNIIIWMSSVLTTILFNNSSGISFLLKNVYIFIGFMLFLNSEFKDNPIRLIHILAYIYHMFILLNFILFLIFPSGIYSVSLVSYHSGHLLGDDNALIYIILPGLIINIIDSYLNKNKISILCVFEIISTIYMFIKLWTVTSLLCIFLFTFLLIFTKKINKINLNIFIYVFFVVCFVLFFGLDNPFIKSFVENTLHKSITLSGRVILWSNSFKMIKNRLFLGYGGYFNHGHFLLNGMIYPCHTPYLQMVIDGGILNLLLFFIMIVLAYHEGNKFKNNRIAVISIIGLTVMLINYIFEYSQYYHLMIILALIFNLKYIVGGYNSEREDK